MENMDKKTKFDSMVFYRGWIQTARELLSEQDAAKIVMQLIDYGLDGIYPDSFFSPVAEAIFKMATPSIDVNIQKKISGAKGGRKPKAKTDGYKKPINPDGKTIGLSNVDADAYVDADADADVDVLVSPVLPQTVEPPAQRDAAQTDEPDDDGITVEEWTTLWESTNSTGTMQRDSSGRKG